MKKERTVMLLFERCTEPKEFHPITEPIARCLRKKYVKPIKSRRRVSCEKRFVKSFDEITKVVCYPAEYLLVTRSEQPV